MHFRCFVMNETRTLALSLNSQFLILTVYLTTLEMFAKRKLSTSLQEDGLV